MGSAVVLLAVVILALMAGSVMLPIVILVVTIVVVAILVAVISMAGVCVPVAVVVLVLAIVLSMGRVVLRAIARRTVTGTRSCRLAAGSRSGIAAAAKYHDIRAAKYGECQSQGQLRNVLHCDVS